MYRAQLPNLHLICNVLHLLGHRRLFNILYIESYNFNDGSTRLLWQFYKRRNPDFVYYVYLILEYIRAIIESILKFYWTDRLRLEKCFSVNDCRERNPASVSFLSEVVEVGSCLSDDESRILSMIEPSTVIGKFLSMQ